MAPSVARVSVPTRALSYQTAVLLWRVRRPARAMRAISGLPRVGYAIRRGQFRAEGLEEAQVDVEAGRYDAVLDVGNGRLRRTRHLAKLLLAHLPRRAPRLQHGPGLAQASDGVWRQTRHAELIACGRYFDNIADELFCDIIAPEP